MFPYFKQHDAMDCGPTCLRMVAKHHGRHYKLETLRGSSYITKKGVSLLGISEAAGKIGFRSIGVRISYEQFEKDAPLPAIVHWGQNHFVVVYKIKKGNIYIADPAKGFVKYSRKEFEHQWARSIKDEQKVGIALLLEPTPDFYKYEGEKSDKTSFSFLFDYVRPHRKLVIQLILGLLVGSLLQMVLPFLTQSVVDFGISNQNLNFVTLVLIGQLVLFTSQAAVEFIRGWILLHISTRINISLISDFLIKLMRLPIAFFDTKMTGDLMQRIGDHRRIETFLTQNSLNILFSIFNLFVFGAVLAYYNLYIFITFVVGSGFYISWIYLFMQRRRKLDFKRFEEMSRNQSNLIQLIQGMQEIKLNNCEQQKRWEWESIQANLFRVSVKNLALEQYQQVGSVFINQSKNIFITFLAASAVIAGNMTLGMMLAVQYIIGQLNSPIEQMVNFLHSTQDAKISMERLGEIHNREDEERNGMAYLSELPKEHSIQLSNVSFQYEGPLSPRVLNELELHIPKGKITAIVGASGSGKTTLLKLILGFYPPIEGEIKVGENRLENISSSFWRSTCGVVMQDGFIFSDTIANNIAVSDEYVDKKKLLHAVKTANIQNFIESLPLTYNTKIGADGHGLSQGQKQRLLIARAVYKDPKFIFLDEATNALDANNEKQIMQNLDRFFEGRTVVVVAHRLSTVKNADQIIVLDQGRIVEQGTHDELTTQKGNYFNLVKNQLELGT